MGTLVEGVHGGGDQVVATLDGLPGPALELMEYRRERVIWSHQICYVKAPCTDIHETMSDRKITNFELSLHRRNSVKSLS